VLLDQHHQQHAGRPQHQPGDLPGLAQPGGLRGGVGRLPHRVGPGRRPDPALRHVDREGRRLRQRRAAHPVLAPAGQGAGRGQVRPVAVHGVLQALQGRGGVAGRADRQEARVQGQDPVRRALRQQGGEQVPEERAGGQRARHQELHQRRVRGLRLLRAEGPVRGIRDLRPRPWPRPGALRRLSQGPRPALAGGRWQGNPVALPRRLRPLRQEGRGREVLRPQGRQGGHLRAALPGPPRSPMPSSTCGCAPAACWSTGTPAR
jgi:hypothetical protein